MRTFGRVVIMYLFGLVVALLLSATVGYAFGIEEIGWLWGLVAILIAVVAYRRRYVNVD